MEKRRHPRIEICSQQKIISLSPEDELKKDIVLSKNLSASGVCVRSPNIYKEGSLFLVHMDDSILEDIKNNRAHVMKSGGYLLAKSVWNTLSPISSDPFYHIGCAFVELAEKDSDKVNLFLQLVNRSILESFETPTS